MSSYLLPYDQYTLSNALLWGNCYNHFYNENEGDWSVVHITIATIECIPLISQIVSLAEFFIGILYYYCTPGVTTPNFIESEYSQFTLPGLNLQGVLEFPPNADGSPPPSRWICGHYSAYALYYEMWKNHYVNVADLDPLNEEAQNRKARWIAEANDLVFLMRLATARFQEAPRDAIYVTDIADSFQGVFDFALGRGCGVMMQPGLPRTSLTNYSALLTYFANIIPNNPTPTAVNQLGAICHTTLRLHYFCIIMVRTPNNGFLVTITDSAGADHIANAFKITLNGIEEAARFLEEHYPSRGDVISLYPFALAGPPGADSDAARLLQNDQDYSDRTLAALSRL